MRSPASREGLEGAALDRAIGESDYTADDVDLDAKVDPDTGEPVDGPIDGQTFYQVPCEGSPGNNWYPVEEDGEWKLSLPFCAIE